MLNPQDNTSIKPSTEQLSIRRLSERKLSTYNQQVRKNAMTAKNKIISPAIEPPADEYTKPIPSMINIQRLLKMSDYNLNFTYGDIYRLADVKNNTSLHVILAII